MRQFDFYEFVGILSPGSVLLIGLSLLYPELRDVLISKDLSIGTLGMFVIFAYVAGHLIQTAGNGVESLLWRALGGMPSDWVRTEKHHLLSPDQVETLKGQLRPKLNLASDPDLASMEGRDWHALTRQVYAAVAAQGRSARVDTFNGNYALSRGLAAALITLAVVIAIKDINQWATLLLVVAGAGLAIYRTYRFGRYYARELFVQFLQLPKAAEMGSSSSASTPKDASK